MILDESKSLRQEQGINIWKENNFHGTLNYIMGFGKTRIIELVVSRTLNRNSNNRIILIVPTDIAYRNVAPIHKKYSIECYTQIQFENAISFKTLDLEKEIFILIIDEIHKFINPKFIKYLKSINYKFCLGLTGSRLSTKNKSDLTKIGFPVIDIITEEEALENNWISDYQEYNLAVEIEDNDKKKIKYLTDNIDNISSNFKGIYKKVNALFKYDIFEGDYSLIQSCYVGKNVLDKLGKFVQFIQSEDLRTIVAHIQGFKIGGIISNDTTKMIQTFWHPDNIQELAKSYMKAVKARNDYLKYNKSKVNMILALTNNINKPTIIYNDSIDMIEHLSSAIKYPSVKYHSQIESVTLKDEKGDIICYSSGEKKGQPKMFGKTYLKNNAIESIISGKAQYLITGRSLNESLNLPNIEYIICTSGDTNPNTYEQRVSRGKRIDSNNKNKFCIIINIYIDDFSIENTMVKSRDKEKLLIRQENVKDAIFIENISELFASIEK